MFPELIVAIIQSPYSTFPYTPLYMNISCSQCKKAYLEKSYARSYYDGEPLYWILDNLGQIIHFCGPECSNDYFKGYFTGDKDMNNYPKTAHPLTLLQSIK